MAEAEQQGLIGALESEAKRRFVRWDAALWRELTTGPAAALAQALAAARTPASQADPLLASYLRLGCEAIGLGYLYPASAGVESFFTLAWYRLVPSLLAEVAPIQRPAVLAACWNLGENLERSPAWLGKIFSRLARGLTRLDALESLVTYVEHQALSPPAKPLDPDAPLVWIQLGAEDPRFLPGALHFVAPTVVCVHDRHRTGAAGRDACTLGVWFAEVPLILGPMSCPEVPSADLSAASTWSSLSPEEPHSAISNPWYLAATLETSQSLLVLGIAPGTAPSTGTGSQ